MGDIINLLKSYWKNLKFYKYLNDKASKYVVGSANYSGGSNKPYYEQGESSNPFHSIETYKPKGKGQRYNNINKWKQMINEEFKPKKSFSSRTSTIFWIFSKYWFNNWQKKTLDMWKAAMILNLIYEPAYAEEERGINAIYNLIMNSFQGIVANWFNGISPSIRSLID